MQLYQFDLYLFDKNTPIYMRELEAVEKPKTFETLRSYGYGRINKSDLGRVNDYGTLYLLEPDMVKAKEIFANYLKLRLERDRNAFLQTEERYQKLLAFDPDLAQTKEPADDVMEK